MCIKIEVNFVFRFGPHLQDISLCIHENSKVLKNLKYFLSQAF
jgi:hypothetical protein